MLNDGNVQFILVQDTISITNPTTIALEDINGDNNLDLIVGHFIAGEENTLSFFANEGGGQFTFLDRINLPLESNIPRSIDFGDLDNDGDLDLLSGGGKLHTFLNDGLGQFIFEKSFDVSTFQVLAEDLNQDSVPDLIATSLVFNSSIFFSTP